jgi:hypothetical protein
MLEGEELKVLEFGHTDTRYSTGLYVPSLGLVVSGDAVYNNTHPYLSEYNDAAGRDWLQALDQIESQSDGGRCRAQRARSDSCHATSGDTASARFHRDRASASTEGALRNMLARYQTA